MSLLNGEVGKTFDLTTLHSYFQKQTITRPEIHTIHLHQCRKVPYTQVQPASTTEIRSVKENLYVWVIEWSNVEYTPCLIGNIKTRYGDPYKPTVVSWKVGVFFSPWLRYNYVFTHRFVSELATWTLLCKDAGRFDLFAPIKCQPRSPLGIQESQQPVQFLALFILLDP